jgi:hypothetical protein
LTGYFLSDSIKFGNTPTLMNGTPSITKIFITKYNSYGSAIWAKSVIGDNNYSSGITVDANSNLFITGYFTGTSIQFGNTPVLSNHIFPVTPHDDIFLTRFDLSGNAQYAISVGGLGYEESQCITTDQSGGIYISGHFTTNYPFQFGNIPAFTNQGISDFFIAKYYDNTVDIKGNNISNYFSVYPNPANDRVSIELNGMQAPENIVISIYGIDGQKIFEQTLQHKNTEIDVSGLAEGIYIIKLINNEITEVRKFVKE